MAESSFADPAVSVEAMVHKARDEPRAIVSDLIQECLVRLMNSGDAEIAVDRRRGRRPRARVDGQNIYLSVSHSAELVAVAASNGPVGIDVERIRKVREVSGVGAHLAPFIPTWDVDTRPSYRHDDVLGAWTRYEAVVKALGVGRVFPPSQFAGTSTERVFFRGMDLPLETITGKLEIAENGRRVGYILSIAARLSSDIVVDHCAKVAYNLSKYER